MLPHRLLIGICGRAEAGKSTLAQALVAAAGGRVVAMADSLRDVVEAAFGARFETHAAKAARCDFWADRLGPDWATGRQILQRVGSELFRAHVHPDFWLFHLERKLSQLPPQPVIAIPDVRFDNEAQWVRAQGGYLVLVRRADQPPPRDAHVSERGVDPALLDWSFTSSSAAWTQAQAATILAQARAQREGRDTA